MSNDIDRLKKQIYLANVAYRIGQPTISDIEYDELCDKLEYLVSTDEWNAFRDTLNEGEAENKQKNQTSESFGNKRPHNFIMGSLDKIKAEEPDNVFDFINKNIPASNKLNASCKLDGISVHLVYRDGKLVDAITRGDGYEGISVFNKFKYIKGIPQNIASNSFNIRDLDVRGELIILDNDFLELSDKYKNARNACAGLINSKEFNSDEISKISCIVYTILGNTYTKEEQFDLLEKLGFLVTKYFNVEVTKNLISDLTNLVKQDYGYTIDGLVLCANNYKNELNEYRPKGMKAFKINEQTGITRIIDVKFTDPSKDGRMTPVAIVEPVEIGGVTISRVTLNNIDYIEKNDIRYGSKVKILRSGDVIPKIIDVVNDEDGCREIELPKTCPYCGHPLIRDGVDVRCNNKNCSYQISQILTHFVKKLNIKNVSLATIQNWKINTYKDIIDFVPNRKYKTEVKFYDELVDKMFNSASRRDLLIAMNFRGVAEKTIEKILDFYGEDFIFELPFSATVEDLYKFKAGYPANVGEKTLISFIDDLGCNLATIRLITGDARYNYKENSNTSNQSSKELGTVCFTGSLNTMSRTAAQQLAEEHGYRPIAGVNKTLTYLVCNDKNSNSSKMKKAKEFNISIINEREFLNLIKKIKEDNNVVDLDNL